LVGTNIGAGQKQRALRIALAGGAIAFAISEALGLIAAFWPQAWLALFSPDPRTAKLLELPKNESEQFLR
ncbi:MAG: hypothetical protein ACXWNK_18560, partial [Vulcanimicrobiaceae bacterium]